MSLFLFSIITLFFNVQANTLCNVLSLSGGGSFGAVEMGMLESLYDSHKIPSSFDILTGISAGGLNVGFLSHYENYADAFPLVRSIFQNLTTADVYDLNILGILSHWSIYDNSPLKNTLTTIFSGLSDHGVPPITLIGASNVNTQHLDIYHFHNLSLSDKIDVLLSTSAIPFVFPPHHFNGNLYVDGGVISNELITQAVGELPCDFYNVTFLSASGRNNPRQNVTGFFSYISSIFHMLFNTFDYQLAQANTCKYPIGVIQACFPDGSLLANYSILDFDYGIELYTIGYNSHECVQMDLCG